MIQVAFIFDILQKDPQKISSEVLCGAKDVSLTKLFR